MSDDRVVPGEATLFCDSALGGASEACAQVLAPSGDESVLWVSYTRSPTECFAQMPEVPAARKAAVDVGGERRSGSSGRQETATAAGSVTVTEPGDLTGLGIAITDHLEAGVRLCFDSITAMLQYVELERAYTFLNSLLGHLWDADTRAHFHLDPAAHDTRTVAAITSLFDARVDPDGTVRAPV